MLYLENKEKIHHRTVEFYKALNRASAAADDEAELLDSFCAIFASILNIDTAWAGFIVELTDKSIVPSSCAGNTEHFISNDSLYLRCADSSCGPTGEVALESKIIAASDLSLIEGFDLWKEKASSFGFKSFCSLPIITDGKVTAVFTALCKEKGRFNKEEMEVITEIINELSICICLISDKNRVPSVVGSRDLLKKFGALFNNTSDAIFVHEMPTNKPLGGRITEINKIACDKFGYTQNELCNFSFDNICQFTGRYSLEESAQKITLTGHIDTEAFIKCKCGELSPVLLSSKSFSMGRSKYIVSILRDVTEKLRTAKQLNLMKNAIEHSTVSVVITNKEGEIEYVNPVFEQTTGYSAKEVIGKKPGILKSENTDPKLFANMWDTISAGKIWKGEICNKKKNGEYYWVSAIIFPVSDDKGEIVNFIGIKEDITDKRILEEQIRHAQRMNIIGEMAGNFTHDLKNIILVIGGFATRLHNKLPEGTSEHQYAEHIMKAVTRAAKLTNGLLTFGRKQPNHPKCIDINLLLNEYADMIEKIIDTKVDLRMRLTEDYLPILVDWVQIEQVLINLASNAKDAMPEGGTLTVTTYKNENKNGLFAVILFEDTGCGMKKEMLNRIFDPFYTTKDPGKGTGLGLSIVYGIIRQHGGTITCSSREGVGTVFEINLPLQISKQ